MRDNRHFPGLATMRGLAAFLVLWLHITLYFSLSDNVFRGSGIHNHVYLLVDCFYMMSGFVIAHSSDRKMAQGLSFSRFMIHRVLRLYPMVLAGVALGALPLLALWKMSPQMGPMPVVWSLVSGAFLIPTTALTDYKPFVFPANSPHWSLSFEMLLCIGYAASFRFLSGFRLVVLAAVCGVALATTSFAAGSLDIGYRLDDYSLGFGRVIYPFLAGILLRRSRFFKPNSQRWGYLAIPVLVAVLMNPLPASWSYDAIVDLAILPVLVWSIVCAKPIPSIDRWSGLIGDVSYPIYAIHFPIVVSFANMSKILHFGAFANAALSVLCSVVVLILSALLYFLYDVPVRHYLTSIVSGYGRPTSTAPTRTAES